MGHELRGPVPHKIIQSSESLSQSHVASLRTAKCSSVIDTASTLYTLRLNMIRPPRIYLLPDNIWGVFQMYLIAIPLPASLFVIIGQGSKSKLIPAGNEPFL